MKVKDLAIIGITVFVVVLALFSTALHHYGKAKKEAHNYEEIGRLIGASKKITEEQGVRLKELSRLMRKFKDIHGECDKCKSKFHAVIVEGDESAPKVFYCTDCDKVVPVKNEEKK